MRPGLSPRGRGNLGVDKALAVRPRSIPAWAGEPGKCWPPAHWAVVYPRVGGGTFTPRLADNRGLGLSPRGRGNRPPV